MVISAPADNRENHVLVESRSGESNRIEAVADNFHILCAVTVLLSAFLVFQVQPIVSKMILPWFGGGASVWTTCLLFFQLVLLAGYGYAFVLNRLFSMRQQAVVHLILVSATLLLLPITPHDIWKPIDGSNPTKRILLLLLANVGLPYFLLSATAPLLQSWFAQRCHGRTPYRLYALSNVGSLTALISYPFVVEPMFPTATQGSLWSTGFVIFAVLCGVLTSRIWKSARSQDQSGKPGAWEIRSPGDSLITLDDAEATISTLSRPNDSTALSQPRQNSPVSQWLIWMGFSAFGSLTLLSVTNHISQEMTVSPILWVFPLSIYLLTFIISFDRPQWFAPRWWAIAAAIAITTTAFFRSDHLAVFDSVLVGVGITLDDFADDIVIDTVLYLSLLFLICMLCHGSLVRRKPPTSQLTSFYLAMATGGAVGGLFVTLVCPWIFASFIETELTLVIGFLLAVWLVVKDGSERWENWKRAVCTISLGSVLPVLWLIGSSSYETGNEDNLVQYRNFYGVLQVDLCDEGTPDSLGMALYHGRTQHGFQYLSRKLQNEPTTYYDRESGVGITLAHLSEQKSIKVGVVGLGVGTLAAYARERDSYHFYEINQDIVKIAQENFYYLKNCKGATTITLGDARISLERQPVQEFDVMVLDAFSGDAIPMHLLTVNAFALYQQHLKSNGVMAVHISNRYLDLFPVVAGAAERYGMNVLCVETDYIETNAQGSSQWLLLTCNDEFINDDAITQYVTPNEEYTSSRTVWTDQYSNLLEVLQ